MVRDHAPSTAHVAVAGLIRTRLHASIDAAIDAAIDASINASIDASITLRLPPRSSFAAGRA